VRGAKAGRGIILTTHSMEEATVLCDRLGMFVDGTLVCIGNPKELTSRYGGYYVSTMQRSGWTVCCVLDAWEGTVLVRLWRTLATAALL
jgi:ABC-type multidrug transport system ATPase subunit